MTLRTLERIEDKIRGNADLPESAKAELLELLAALKTDISAVPEEETEHMESMAGFMEQSTHEAMRKKRNQTLLKLAIDGLTASVGEFEKSHPDLVKNVNYIATELANMGI